MNRRYFLLSSAVALKASQLRSPNDTIRAACIGVRGQGAGHIRNFSSLPNTELAAICDEAHRFAIEYHRTLRSKGGIASGIEQIPGIGAKRRTALLKHFGSLQRLKEADVEEIAVVQGMTSPLAQSVYTTMHQEEGPQ